MPAISWEYSLTSLFSSIMSGMISSLIDLRATSIERKSTGESFSSSSARKGESSRAEARATM